MCGLAGLFSLDGAPLRDAEARIARMTARLRHRGPDSQGTCVTDDRRLALGNTRLAIVDPEDRTPQPLWSADGGGVISFNGEIYNYLDLRQALSQQGIAFRTGLDTEILLEGLRRQGLDLLPRLDGMWAFAYYEPAQGRLVLSRDLLGERHLFYRIHQGELAFASEMDALLADSPSGHRLDLESALTALRFQGAGPGRTLVTGFNRLKPGHVLTADRDGRIEERAALRLDPRRWRDFFDAQPDLETVMDRFDEVLGLAAARRVPRDVPFVSTLSGGIDSTLVCAYASDHGARPIDTLFGQSDEAPARVRKDELDEYDASLVSAARFNTRHVKIRIDVPDAAAVLRDVADRAADGMVDWGVGSFRMLAEQVRDRGIKVMLVSEGPDELMGGYKVDRQGYAQDLLAGRRPGLHRVLALAGRSRTARGVLRRVAKRPDLLVPAPQPGAAWWSPPHHQAFETDFLSRFLPWEALRMTPSYGVLGADYADLLEGLDNSQKRALAYAATSIPDYANLRLDKGFMSASVESRSPHLAPSVVELYLAARGHHRFGEGMTKHVLRKLVERKVGPQVAFRSKHGFSAPIWKSKAVAGELRVRETIADSEIFRLLPFRPDAKDRILGMTSTKIQWPLYVLATVHHRLKTAAWADPGQEG